MIQTVKESLWKQFGASIDMLKNAIELWPETSLENDKRFFFTTYHCLVFLDYYLTMPPPKFSSPLPFTLSEPGVVVEGALDDVIPDRQYTKQELLAYLETSREKCQQLIGSLTEERLAERWIEDLESGAMDYALLEIILYNMRHVQHHTAQLNLLLRQQINNAPRWVSRAADQL